MKLAVYIELPYSLDADGYSSDQPFMRFVLALRPHVEKLVLIGRVDPAPGRQPYAIPADVHVIPLPHYPSLKHLGPLLQAAPRAFGRIWHALDGVDTVWSIGPHPLSVPVALMGVARRRRVVLGVRQHFPDYVRYRLPNRRWRPILGAAWLLEGSFRLLARRLPAVVVGPDLARRYRSPRAPLLEITVPLVSEDDLADRPRKALAEGAEQPIELLSVGRLESDKAPWLLLEMLELLRGDNGRFRLTVAGTGDLERQLRDAAAGLGDVVRFLGHVPHGRELFELYRRSDIFVHTARTEGLPSVLIEAQLFGLPVVGTDVGGVRAALAEGEAGLLVPPGDSVALARAVRALADDPERARRLAARGLECARSATLERVAADVAAFIARTTPCASV